MPSERSQNGPRIEPTTSSDLEQVCGELQQREPIFHQAEFGTTRHDYQTMMDPEFWEVGASGRRYSRDFVLDTLENRLPDADESKWTKRDFQCREIAADNYLVTYTLIQGHRITRRATLWRRTAEGWKILYHQGTLVEALP